MAKMNQGERDKKAAWFRQAAGEDGFLSANEIRRCLKEQNGIDLPYSDVIKMFRDLDANGDGKVTFEEFMGAMDGAEIQRQKLIKFFKQVDKNGDGMLTEDELIHALSTMDGVQIDMAGAQQMIKVIDVDKDGKINMWEFINAMCS